MKKIVKKFENFVCDTGLEPFDFVSQRGHWKQLTVRTTQDGEMLVISPLIFAYADTFLKDSKS
jgi:hypothetical protein